MNQSRCLFVKIFLLFILCTSSPALASTQTDNGFTLVLSGGGARGLAQIGVLRALDECGMKPSCIVATSMGAIIGSFYACGYSPDFIEKQARQMSWNSIFSNSVSRTRQFVSDKTESQNYLWEMQFDDNMRLILPTSLSYGQAVYNYTIPWLTIPQYKAGMNFDSLPVQLRITATDILSGYRVVFSKGNISTAIRASCAIPLAYSPVYLDSMILLDGGLSANIPVSVAKELSDRVVVAVDVTSELWQKKDLDNPVHFVDQIASIGIKVQKEKDRALADIVISPSINKITNNDFSSIDTLIKLGYMATKAAIPDIQKLIDKASCSSSGQSLHIDSDTQTHTVDSCMLTNDENFEIASIAITGNQKTRTSIIKTASGLKVHDSINCMDLLKILSSVYSTNLFKNVNLELDTNNQIKFTVEEKKYLRMRFGLRFDEFHLGEGFIQPAYENLFGSGIQALLHLQYGLRREKYSMELQAKHLFTSNFANNLLLQMYISKDRIFQREIIYNDSTDGPDQIVHNERSLTKSGILVLAGTSIGRSALLGLGLKMERFKIQVSNKGALDNYFGLSFNTLPFWLLKFNIDSMDKFPFAKSGSRHFVIIDGSWEKINNHYLFNAAGGLEHCFTSKGIHSFTPRIQLAWSNTRLPEVERRYLGGMIPEQRNREIGVYNMIQFIGLEPRALSGDLLGLFHIDYRLQISQKFHASAIIDWGNVWEKGQYKTDELPDQFIKYAPLGLGISLAYVSPLGPMILSFGQTAKSLNRMGIRTQPTIYFSAGHDF
ncbi:MAG: patatin-like phospholipase family protein [Fibrobacterota bacterium]